MYVSTSQPPETMIVIGDELLSMMRALFC